MKAERGRGSVTLLVCASLLAGVMLVLGSLALPAYAGRMGERGGRNAGGYLGINFRDVVDEQVSVLKLKESRGVEIVLIDHDGPAFRSGLREHDVILQINAQVVDGAEQLRRILRDTPAGKTVAFTISRDGLQQTLSAQLANREKVGRDAWERHMTVPEPAYGGESTWHANSFLGGGVPKAADVPQHPLVGNTVLTSSYTGALLETMGPQLAEFFGSQGGLLVREVETNSPAALAGLRAGDVVVKVNSVPVQGSVDWMKTIFDNRGRSVAVVVLRDRKEQILTLTPDAKKRSSVAVPWPWPAEAPGAAATEGMLRLPGRIE